MTVYRAYPALPFNLILESGGKWFFVCQGIFNHRWHSFLGWLPFDSV